MKSAIHVIGLGAAEKAELSEAALSALKDCSLVIGSERQIDSVSDCVSGKETLVLPKLTELKLVLKSQTSPIAVLASGDPLFYGIGKWLFYHFEERVMTYPAVSSVQMFCHRLQQSMQSMTVISAHGRSLAEFRRKVRAGNDYIVFTDSKHTPKRLAQECMAMGLTDSLCVVAEKLGYETEKLTRWSVSALASAESDFDALNLFYVKAKGQCTLPSFPGIEDDAFVTEEGSAMITKKEVRLAVLSLLSPNAGEIGWDVGAGCGSVAIEWGLWSEAKVYAIEPKAARLACIAANQEKFGVQNVERVEGMAPEALASLPPPQAVFVGGSEGNTLSILLACYKALSTGGRLVISCVTEDTRFQVEQFLHEESLSYELTEIATKRLQPLGKKQLLKPALPVKLYKVMKA